MHLAFYRADDLAAASAGACSMDGTTSSTALGSSSSTTGVHGATTPVPYTSYSQAAIANGVLGAQAATAAAARPFQPTSRRVSCKEAFEMKLEPGEGGCYIPGGHIKNVINIA